MTVYPVPTDATYDYVPITSDLIVVGSDVLAVMQSEGTVTIVVPDTTYVYVLETVNPDGTTGTGFAFFPVDWSGLDDEWWLRLRLWKRAAKPALRDKVTGSDGSKWIYPDTGDGKMLCYHPGTVFGRGDRVSRGRIETDPRDLFVADDTEWDWLPVTDATTVTVGDVITFGYAQTGAVDVVDPQDFTSFTRTEFRRADSDTLGWVDTPNPGQFVPQWTPTAQWDWFARLAKPASETEFRCADGSLWIYTDGAYCCYLGSAAYPAGSVFQRGEITGGLTVLP